MAALADALNHLVTTGAYARLLAARNLSAESVPTSEINPAGLLRTDS